MNALITIAYDGTNYFGWQRQESFISVQQRVEEAISQLLKKDVSIRGASRTDTGVHALGQRALFKEDFSIPIERIPMAINSFLPRDIVINHAEEVNNEFHPQYSVVKKTYEYKILNDRFPNPLLGNYSEFVRYELDVEKMQEACSYFLGTHDFESFCAAGATVKSKIRTIYELKVEKKNNIISIRITGNGFLYNMVRIIAGTLIYVGLGKIKPKEISEIIEAKDRSRAGKTVSPCGLTLLEIFYS